MRHTPRALLAALLMAAAPAMAQPPPDIAAELGRIGRTIAPSSTAALYAPLHGTPPWQGVRVIRDAAYGTDARHRLDVFAPEAVGQPRPVLVFIPGGDFTDGGKQMAGFAAFYDNIGVWAVREGFVGVNLDHRLAPAHPYPAAQQDIGAALAWVAANIRAHGGDPGRVVLMGHSAGATHAAIYAADPRFRPAGMPAPVSYVLISGLYDFAGEDVPPNERAYFGEGAAERTARSPRQGLVDAPEALMLVHAALDPPRFVAATERMATALRDAGAPPTLVTLDGHSHMSEVMAIGTGDTSLTEPLAAFIRR